ncbi:MAG: hypothetical protein KAI50_03375 [Desulfobacterales bacterium]|nr:hypothetical protein [Desulfobacterales bacterium]
MDEHLSFDQIGKGHLGNATAANWTREIRPSGMRGNGIRLSEKCHFKGCILYSAMKVYTICREFYTQNALSECHWDERGACGNTDKKNAKRARKAETPKQPSIFLSCSAPYFYPTGMT